MVWPSPVQAGIVAMLAAGIGYVLYLQEDVRWYAILSERFLYGVPWGTLVTLVGVISFYLFAQSGLSHWHSPVTLPFRTWSYLYPEGLLTAGFAHAGPDHLVGNMLGTLVLAPIAEYFWGHYSPDQTKTRRLTDVTRPPVEGWLARPWVRALVVFPAAVFLVSVLTSLFSPGWSLGFSGTVFAFGGFALVRYPVTTIVSMVALTVVNVLYRAVTEPTLIATAQPGAPGPPSWVGVNVFAHLLGFLIGVVLALWLSNRRNYRPVPERIFAGAVVFVLARQLWAFTTVSGDTYSLHRAVGVVFALGVAVAVTAAAAGRNEPIPALFENRRVPSRRRLSILYLGLIVVLAVFASIAGDGSELLGVLAVLSILAAPAVPALVPDWFASTPLSRRTIFATALVGLIGVVAVLSVFSLAVVVSDDPVPGDGELDIGEYTITYEENVSDGRIGVFDAVPFDGGTSSGVIVVDRSRHLWSAAVQPRMLAHAGDATVPVGGIGWRDTVDANRTGWNVLGADTVYAVDLETNDERVRSFTADAVTYPGRISDHRLTLEATQGAFRVNVTRDNATVGVEPIPGRNESVHIGEFSIQTTPHDDGLGVFVEHDGTRTLIAERETY